MPRPTTNKPDSPTPDDQVLVNEQEQTPERPLSFSRAELGEVLTNPDFKPEDLINFLKQDFSEEFAGRTRGTENYTLEEHTVLAMRQFEKYYQGSEFPPSVDDNFFRVLFAFHDIGKPSAIAAGEKWKQHEHTAAITEPALQQLEFAPHNIKLMMTIINSETMNGVIRGRLATEDAVEQIRQAANESGIPAADFFQILKTFHLCDMAAYTADAGGQKNTDKLFRFDHEAGTMDLAPRKGVKDRVDQLQNALAQTA